MSPLNLRPLLALALVATAACEPDFGRRYERQGFINLQTYDDSLAGPVLKPVGAFYHYSHIPTGFVTNDTCVVAGYNATNVGLLTLPTLDAGDVLIAKVSGRTDSLFQESSTGMLLYGVLTVPFIPFTPGDTMDITIPGAPGGFPPTSIKVRTAEAFTLTPFLKGASGDPITVNWTAAPEPGARMNLSLRFSSLFDNNTPNTQVFCSVADDGSHVVPAELAEYWREAPDSSRSVAIARIRHSVVSLSSRIRVTLTSSYEQPLPPVLIPSP